MQIRDKNPEKSKDVYTNFRKNSTMDISKQIQTSKEEKTIKDKLKELKDLQDMVGDGINKSKIPQKDMSYPSHISINLKTTFLVLNIV